MNTNATTNANAADARRNQSLETFVTALTDSGIGEAEGIANYLHLMLGYDTTYAESSEMTSENIRENLQPLLTALGGRAPDLTDEHLNTILTEFRKYLRRAEGISEAQSGGKRGKKRGTKRKGGSKRKGKSTKVRRYAQKK